MAVTFFKEIVFVIGYCVVIISAVVRPPKIFFAEEYIAESNDNLTIRCEGFEPIMWTYPNNTINETFVFSSVTIESVPPSRGGGSGEYRHASLLTLKNISYVDTGFYYCHGRDADIEDKARSSKIYLFVHDETQLTVLNDVESVSTISQYTEVIIPCRPTSPEIHVTLLKSADDSEGFHWDKVPLNERLEDGSVVRFDARLGFIVIRTDFEETYHEQQYIYSCIFTRDNLTKDVHVIVVTHTMTSFIAKPNIDDLNVGHTIVGDTLKLKCTIKCAVQFDMNWKVPGSVNLERVSEGKVISLSDNEHYKILYVRNVTKADVGNYSCLVKDALKNKNNNTFQVNIFGTDEHFIRLSEENNVYNITANAGGASVQWSIDVDAHPINNMNLSWVDNKGEGIGWSIFKLDSQNMSKYNDIIEVKGVKYETRCSTTEAFLKIKNININDFGTYTLMAKNEYEEAELKLNLHVIDKPSVQIKMKEYHFLMNESEIKCIAAGFPEPAVYWKFKGYHDKRAIAIKPSSIERNGLQVISKISINATKSGIITCFANNTLGSDMTTSEFIITDVAEGFNIWHSDNLITETGMVASKVAIGETVELNCGATDSNNSAKIEWWRVPDVKMDTTENFVLERSHTEFSHKAKLIILSAREIDSGEYFCRVNGTNREANITLEVLAPQYPVIYRTNINDSMTLELPDGFNLKCYFRGIPKPTIVWYKDGVEMIMPNRSELYDNGQELRFHKTNEADEGVYSCKISNNVGMVSKSVNITFKNKFNRPLIYGFIAILCVFLVAVITILVFKIIKERKLKNELAGFENFEKGQMESLNPELGIDDQAELLPYDKKWEIPRENLKLGKQLGSGAFGVVMKAEAAGLEHGEDSTTVAVKMVKRNAENAYIRALASELKIMVHLGKHINVVNLLGACTKNVAKRELLVVVEYCRFGNLHNYLLRHRECYIDQVDTTTGRIDYGIGADVLDERTFSFSSNRSENGGHINKLMADYRGASNTAETMIMDSGNITQQNTEDLMSMSNNSNTQPEWRSNYRGDYKGKVQPISTKDLLTWAFQVSRGMEYLAERKVLHGDLAARNILLADNNIVKICDFGLAKSMYKNGNYKKKGDGPLPIKWMAIESIRDRVFSTQSDVWSFGIVLWEFFSLARTPYPGMEADERLYQKLLNGYRMDSPNFATKDIYQMMLSCWESQPQHRPSFSRLADKIGYMLDESVKQFYIDLNDPYLTMNTKRLEEGQSDYLAMFSPPDFESLSSPQNYVNEPPGAHPNGYMCMKPGQIFSPREDGVEGDVFTFEMSRLRSEPGDNGEQSPMLHSPVPDSFSNPSYHALPNITPPSDGILQSADNYVNMPQNKSAIVSKKNPESHEVPYMNSSTRDWERVEV